MNGIILSTTVIKPIAGIPRLEGESVFDLLSSSDGKKMIHVLLKAAFSSKPQWCDIRVRIQDLILLIYYFPDDVRFIIHEAPYDLKCIKEIKERLSLAAHKYN